MNIIIQSKRSLFGKFGDYSNKLFTTPIKDLWQSHGMGVHVAGMFFFKATAGEVLQLLGLLEKSTKGKSMANYAAITAERANLPDDVLQAIPLESIENSAVGDAPASLWQKLVAQVTNVAVTVTDFMINLIVGLPNLVEEAAKIVEKFAMSVYSTAVSTVKSAVAVVKMVVSELKQAIISIVKGIINKIVKPIQNAIDAAGKKLDEFAEEMVNIFKGKFVKIDILRWILGSDLYKVALIVPGILLTVYGIITAASMGMGAIVMNYLPGLIISTVSDNILSMQSGHVSFSLSGTLLQGFGNAVKSLLGNIDVYKALKFGAALLGFVLSMFCTLQTYYVLNGKMFELKNAEDDLNNMLNKLADTVNVFKNPEKFVTEAVPTVIKLTAVQTMMKEVKNDLTGSGWWMSILGVTFSVISIGILLYEWVKKGKSQTEKAILYGFSMGVGLGGVVTSLYSLAKSSEVPGVGWLSGLSVILGTASILDGIYEPQR